MAFVYSLCSSSKGNSTYIGDKKCGILVDAGLSLRAFKQSMNNIGIECDAVKGIFITHEHTDHIKGLKTISKLLNVPIFSSKKTLQYLIHNDKLPENSVAVEINKKSADMGDFSVSCFNTPHDSVHSLGYKLNFANGKTACVCTDLGHMTDEVYSSLYSSDFVLLESNYDENMLMMGPYPYFLKNRIRSETGHLSNNVCGNTLIELLKSGTTKFMLGHLSENNNRPDLAYNCALDAMASTGASIDKDFLLSVAKVNTIGETVEI